MLCEAALISPGKVVRYTPVSDIASTAAALADGVAVVPKIYPFEVDACITFTLLSGTLIHVPARDKKVEVADVNDVSKRPIFPLALVITIYVPVAGAILFVAVVAGIVPVDVMFP